MIAEILRLKKEKNGVILAHYYVDKDIQEICDFLGDSLELSRKAAQTDADVIVFCGVHFMAETAAIISPNKKVLIPALNAGCSLADGITGEDLRKWNLSHPNGVVISYVNTTADVKAETDICCTSANAVKVANSVPADKEVLFVPDYNLGQYINYVSGRKMEVWDGNCCVHKKINSQMVNEMMERYPQADVLIHPESECSGDEAIIKNERCFFYSTSGIIKHAKESPKRQFIIATEIGVINKMEKECQGKELIPISPKAICTSMKKCTLENLYQALLYDRYQVVVEKSIADKAIVPIKRMLEL